jgi:putative transposase
MEASDLSRLKVLEAENRKHKKLFADVSLHNMALKDVIEESCKANRSQTVCALCRH